jgi:transposase
MPRSPVRPSPPDPSKIASGKPGAVQVVERTLAWLNRNRRLAKDFEATIASAQAWVYVASVQLLIRRIAYA